MSRCAACGSLPSLAKVVLACAVLANASLGVPGFLCGEKNENTGFSDASISTHMLIMLIVLFVGCLLQLLMYITTLNIYHPAPSTAMCDLDPKKSLLENRATSCTAAPTQTLLDMDPLHSWRSHRCSAGPRSRLAACRVAVYTAKVTSVRVSICLARVNDRQFSSTMAEVIPVEDGHRRRGTRILLLSKPRQSGCLQRRVWQRYGSMAAGIHNA